MKFSRVPNLFVALYNSLLIQPSMNRRITVAGVVFGRDSWLEADVYRMQSTHYCRLQKNMYHLRLSEDSLL